jgi:exonuclease III
MRCLFWNIRGFDWRGRRTILKEYLSLHKIDMVFLQETVKQEFTDTGLRSLEVGEKFFWWWLPANGHSGGMLTGVRDSIFEVGRMDKGQHFLSLFVLHRATNRLMEIMGIYGPADNGRARGFLAEISEKIASCTLPLLMGGDFNLIRSATDKNNYNLNWPLIDFFNDNIASWALREIPRTGRGIPGPIASLILFVRLLTKFLYRPPLRRFSPSARLQRRLVWDLIIPRWSLI